MPTSRTFFIVLLLVVPLVIAPTVFAKPPKAISNVSGITYPQAQKGAAVALDAQGRFGFVALRPDPNAACGSTSTGGLIGQNPLACKPDVAQYDLERATSLEPATQGTGDNRPDPDAAIGVGLAVTPTAPGTAHTNVYGVKAGPGDVFAVVRAQSSSPVFQAAIPDDLPVAAAALTKDNARVVVGGGSIQVGYLAVWTGPPSSTMTKRWEKQFPDGETVNALAVAKDEQRLVVGTDNAVYFFPDLDAQSWDSAKPWSKLVQSPVRAVDIDDDGSAVVVGLESGEVYYFVTEDRSGKASKDLFESYFSARLDGAINAVAVSGDGRRFAAASGAREFALFEGETQDSGAFAVKSYEHATEANLVDIDAGTSGSTFAAAGGVNVYGYSPSRSTPSWSIALVDDAKSVAVSADGNRIVAASDTRFYSWTQTSDVRVEAFEDDRLKNAQPNERISYSFTLVNDGSLQDNYSITVHRPPDWFVEGEFQTRVLAPDTSSVVNFTVQSPTTALPMKHMGRVEVFSQTLKKVVRNEFFNVTIAQVSNLRMTSDQGTTLSLNQGEEVPYVFRIINQGNSYARLNITVTQSARPEWTITYPDREINLTQGQELQLSATLVAPRDATDGACNQIRISAVSGRTGANLPVTACINPEYQIGITLDTSAVAPKPGETSIVKVRVENRGNTMDKVRLETAILPAGAALDWTVKIDPQEFDLERGGVRTATVSVRAAVANPPDATITIRATSEGGTPQSVTLTAGAPLVEEENFLPGPSFVAFAAAVAAIAALARRRER